MNSVPYFNVYNPQPSLDRINDQINQLENMKKQLQQPIPQPTNLTQNFQLAPNNNTIKYAESIDEVQKSIVIGETPYFSHDMSIVWVKNTQGNINTYELKEIVAKDEKDLTIEYLQNQLEELKGMIKNESNVTNDISAEDEPDTSEYDESIITTTKKNKSTGLSRISKSKAK